MATSKYPTTSLLATRVGRGKPVIGITICKKKKDGIFCPGKYFGFSLNWEIQMLNLYLFELLNVKNMCLGNKI